MRLRVIGCAGSMPSPDSPASCYLVEHEGHRLVLDLGNGAIGPLQRHVDLSEAEPFEGVLLSHGHIDHCADAGSLFVARAYGPGAPLPLVSVFGPSGIGPRLAQLYGPTDIGLDAALAIAEFPSGPFELGPFRIATCPAAHPVPAVSMRIEAGGRSLAYSGDTGPNDGLRALAEGVDLALFEASWIGDGHPPSLHLSATEAGSIARSARAKALMITHLPSWTPAETAQREASAAFGARVLLAAPGLDLEL